MSGEKLTSAFKQAGRTMLIPFLLSLPLVMTVFTYALAAAEKDRERAEIIERAKKEGEVMLYVTGSDLVTGTLMSTFKGKYPFLNVKYFRAEANNLANRTKTEYNVGKYYVDVIATNFRGTQFFYEGGLLEAYKSPEREALPDYAKDAEGYWTATYLNLGVIGYNTKLVPPQRVPKSYFDLLDPWWKRKIGVDTTDHWWYGLMLHIWGEEKGRSFMQKLAQQEVTLRRGQTLKVQLLAAGELSAIVHGYNTNIEPLKRQGAPVNWVAPQDQPIIPSFSAISVAKKAPHPHAAKLYIDFLLSEQGQRILAQLKVPVRVDVLPNPPSLVQGADGKRFNVLRADFEMSRKANEKAEEFRNLFRLHK